jgi:hypothetical protein
MISSKRTNERIQMNFIAILTAILTKQPIKIKLPPSPTWSDISDIGLEVTQGRLSAEAKDTVLLLQRLMALVEKDASVLISKLPISRQKVFKDDDELYQKVGKVMLKRNIVSKNAEERVAVLRRIIIEIVLNELPSERKLFSRDYFLTREGKLLRGVSAV